MKKYLLRKQLFAVIFLVLLFGYSAVNAWYGQESWREAVLEGAGEPVSEMVKALDESIIESLYGRMRFIETYSFLQVVLDKREINNFENIKDEDGYLHYASFFREETENIKEYAKRVKRLQDHVAAKGTRVLFCVTPAKYVRGEVDLREGISVNDPHDIVNELLFYLNRYGVETLDYRKYFPNEERSLQDTFFKTDHHWTIPAAFEAAEVLVEVMNEKFDAGLDPDGCYLNEDNYEWVTYRNCMLGTMGRRTGANFSGVEDFEALWPKFDISYEREYINGSGVRRHKEGTAQESFMDTEVLTNNSNIYRDSAYSLYLDGVNQYEKIVNPDNPEGCRILMIRDSYFSPVMVFLAPMCSEIEALWLLDEPMQIDAETYIDDHDYDYIILEVYPYNINGDAFCFFEAED